MKQYWKAFKDDSLTASQIAIYVCLCTHQGNNEGCYPSIGTIAKESHYSVSTVKRAIKALSAKKYIKVIRQKRPNGGDTSNRYKCLI